MLADIYLCEVGLAGEVYIEDPVELWTSYSLTLPSCLLKLFRLGTKLFLGIAIDRWYTYEGLGISWGDPCANS